MKNNVIRADCLPSFVVEAHKRLTAQKVEGRGANVERRNPIQPGADTRLSMRVAKQIMPGLQEHGRGVFSDDASRTVWYREGDFLRLRSDFDKERLIAEYLDECSQGERRARRTAAVGVGAHPINVKCKGCSKQFDTDKSTASNDPHHYCSKACEKKAPSASSREALRKAWGKIVSLRELFEGLNDGKRTASADERNLILRDKTRALLSEVGAVLDA